MKLTVANPAGLNFKKSNIRIWIHQRNLTNLQQVVWEGHGSKLLVEHSNNSKIKRFLEAVPHIMGLIKEVHSDVINGDLENFKNRVQPPIPKNVLSAKDCNGLTPLHKAAGLGKMEIVDYIVKEDPSCINATDAEGRTPLHYAALLKDDGKMMKFLIENGADESTLDNKQKTAGYYKTRHSELDSKLLTVIPECPRTAKESFLENFDWGMLTAVSSVTEVASKAIKKVIEEVNEEKAEEKPPDEPKDNENTHAEENTENQNDTTEELKNNKTEQEERPQELPDNPEEAPTEAAEIMDEPQPEPNANEKDATDNQTESNKDEKENVETVNNENGEAEEDKPNEEENTTEQEEPESNTINEHNPGDDENNNKHNEEQTDTETNETETNKEGFRTRPSSKNNGFIPNGDIRSRPGSTIESKTRPSSKMEETEEPKKTEKMDNEERRGSKDAEVESEGIIEGVVNGEDEVEPMNNEGQNQKSRSPENEEEIKALVKAGNMEQLAALVLNGEGEKLVGQESDNQELQSFLENVPVYMSKINRIHIAARDGSLRDLQAALDRRKFAIAKDVISPNGASPLHVAVIFCHTSIVRYLAGRFPETIQMQDDNGRTPLHYSAVLPDNGHYFNLLTHLGADTRIKDKFDHNAEYYITHRSEFSHKSLLADFGAEEDEAEEIINDKVPHDTYSARKNLDDEDMISVLERCYNVLQGRRNSNAVSASSNTTVVSSTNTISSNNLLGKHMKRGVFDAIKLRVTKLDHNLYDIIWPSVKKLPTEPSFRLALEQDFPLGIVAPDLYAYRVFEEFLEPLIKDYNYIDLKQELSAYNKSQFLDNNNSEVDVNLDPQNKWIITDSNENGQVDMPFFATEEGRYLASSLGDPLIKGLTEVANKRPQDPIAYLATYLYNFASSRGNLKSRGQAQENHHEKIITGSPQTVNDNKAIPASIEVVTVEPEEYREYEDSAFNSTSRDEHGQSMLHFAAARGHGRNALFQLLLETQINVAFRDELYRTARDITIQANIPENTAEIDRYVLHIATKGDTDKLVELLLDGYDHITDIVDEDEVPIVEAVSKENQPETVSFLQSILAFEEKRERVHHAIRQGSITDVRELLADENDTGSGKLLSIGKNSYGRCTIHVAVLCQQEEIVDYLAMTFPDTLRIGDNLERTALHYAMGMEKMESISRVLVKAGAKRVVKDLKGRQPTYYFLNKSDILRLKEEEETF